MSRTTSGVAVWNATLGKDPVDSRKKGKCSLVGVWWQVLFACKNSMIVTKFSRVWFALEYDTKRYAHMINLCADIGAVLAHADSFFWFGRLVFLRCLETTISCPGTISVGMRLS